MCKAWKNDSVEREKGARCGDREGADRCCMCLAHAFRGSARPEGSDGWEHMSLDQVHIQVEAPLVRQLVTKASVATPWVLRNANNDVGESI